jgi:CRISPR-associated exonuclease Cas4
MNVSGTHFNYYQVCKRKLWLFSNGISMEYSSDLVYEGRMLHKTSYPQRPERYTELEIDGIKIDYYDARNKIIHEIKKSDKIENAHQWQVKYYIYILEKNAINGVKGLLEYPMIKHTAEVILSDEDRSQLVCMKDDILRIIEGEKCPDIISSKICKQCSYFEFCYVREEEP